MFYNLFLCSCVRVCSRNQVFGHQKPYGDNSFVFGLSLWFFKFCLSYAFSNRLSTITYLFQVESFNILLTILSSAYYTRCRKSSRKLIAASLRWKYPIRFYKVYDEWKCRKHNRLIDVIRQDYRITTAKLKWSMLWAPFARSIVDTWFVWSTQSFFCRFDRRIVVIPCPCTG